VKVGTEREKYPSLLYLLATTYLTNRPHALTSPLIPTPLDSLMLLMTTTMSNEDDRALPSCSPRYWQSIYLSKPLSG